MKTGIVMEISKGKAVLLTKEGTFVTYRIPKGKNPKIGQEYAFDFFRDPYRFQFLFPTFSISLAAVLTFILYHGSMPLSRAETVAAYVSFDINPSLEVAVGEDLRILSVTTFNEDAEKALSRIGNVKGYTLSQFSDELMADYEREGYFARNRELMIVTSRTEAASLQIKQKIEQSVKAISIKTSKRHHVAVSSSSASLKTRNEAKKKGVTAGKFSLYLHAKKNNRTLTVKQAGNMTVSQLKTEVSQNTDRSKAETVVKPGAAKMDHHHKPSHKIQLKKVKHEPKKSNQNVEIKKNPVQNKQKKDKNLQKKSTFKLKVKQPVKQEKEKHSRRTHEDKGKGKEKHKKKSVK